MNRFFSYSGSFRRVCKTLHEFSQIFILVINNEEGSGQCGIDDVFSSAFALANTSYFWELGFATRFDGLRCARHFPTEMKDGTSYRF